MIDEVQSFFNGIIIAYDYYGLYVIFVTSMPLFIHEMLDLTLEITLM